MDEVLGFTNQTFCFSELDLKAAALREKGAEVAKLDGEVKGLRSRLIESEMAHATNSALCEAFQKAEKLAKAKHEREIAAEKQKLAKAMAWCEQLQQEKAVLEEQRLEDQRTLEE